MLVVLLFFSVSRVQSYKSNDIIMLKVRNQLQDIVDILHCKLDSMSPLRFLQF